ncbi:MAG: hypothetical protein ACO1PN_04995 [Betaproteobacteria bacterium]
MSIDFTQKELERESDEELQRRMDLYKPESGAYLAAKAAWDKRKNASMVRRERLMILFKFLGIVLGIPSALYASYQFAKSIGWL